VELLLKRGANPVEVGDGKMTPLHYASTAGHFDVVRVLLQFGADVSVKNRLVLLFEFVRAHF